MDFGKNRVQYNDFYWSFYRYDNFDTYFNQDGEAIARFTGKHASDEILRLEEKLNHKLNKRLTFLVYNKYSDFRQSNIGLVTGKEEYNTGGITKIRNNKVSLYFQGNHEEYLNEMRSAIAEIIVSEMLYGSKLTENFASSSMISLPEWYLKGLTSYLANDWSTEIENRIKDGIENNRYDKFNRLNGEDAIYAGHSFWKYINDYYGNTVITDIIYLTHVNKGANNAILGVLGLPFKEVTHQWLKYYEDYFDQESFSANDTGFKKLVLKKHKTATYYSQVKVNPSGEKLAYISNELGQVKVWIYDYNEQKSKKILKLGHKIKQINDYTYPVIEWHPTGELLTIITEKEGGLKFINYIVNEDKMVERNLLYFDKILNLNYSDDGTKLTFSAVKDSKTDIYVFDIASSTHEHITDDLADDFNPRFINNSDEIIFTSNRLNDTLQTNQDTYGKQFDLFIYDYKNKSSILSRLTSSVKQNEVFPIEHSFHKYYYLNDQNGIRNLFYGKYDSTISFIDTSIHYRYFLDEKSLTNLSRNIKEHHLSRNKQSYAFINYNNGNYNVNKGYINSEQIKNDVNLDQTNYKKELEVLFDTQDSIKMTSPGEKSAIDSAKIFSIEDNYVNVNDYVFEIEKSYYKYKYDSIKADTSIIKKTFPKIQIYQRTFFTDHVVSQVDFSFLNATYQAFTGGAVYFNPGFNALFKIGASDLLEDFKVIAGVRFSADFNSNEYLVSLENLKKKIDEQYIFHRQSFENTTETFISKTQTNKLMYLRTLPFSQITALKGTLTLRHDKQINLSIDRNSLQASDIHKLWAGIKFDYIFDNTISTGLNLYNGTRYKIFGEYYNQINKSKTDLFVLGADLRHYQKIHRDLIFASRFAASTSFGNSKLIYYLGGVDNWTNFSQSTPTFIPLNEIPINENEDYAYQAVATNLRGFPQNIRNGNSFALINTELRWPVIKYFSNYPLNSSFWSNLQLVGFFDVGTAWSGWSPYSDENAYNKDVRDYGSIVVTVDTERDPIVAGYGLGLRAMLFGYFARFDWAWGIENQKITPQIFYFSLSLDF
ncbi:MAG: hypothetical protein C0597_15325 [Marinilabiliales bacterium]|nr:MAG: hypothetical protein C0597_15325 [Marinilabiliales bacterium]